MLRGQEPYHQGEPYPELNKRGGFWGALSPSWIQAPVLCPGLWPGEGLVPPPPDQPSILRGLGNWK